MRFCTNATAGLLKLLMISSLAFGKQNIADLAMRCNVPGKRTACHELAALDSLDKDPAVRIEAIRQLMDQSVLTKILERSRVLAERQAVEARLASIRSQAAVELADSSQPTSSGSEPAASTGRRVLPIRHSDSG